MAANKEVYYAGLGSNPTCNLCGDVFNGTMFDARIPTHGWANICRGCFKVYMCSLGTGSGQKYQQQSDGRWLKVAG